MTETLEERLTALRARYRRRRMMLLSTVALLLTATGALSSATQAPRALLRLVLGAGLPGPNEVVPRQIPWTGVLEHDGGLVNDPALPIQVSLLGADGGVQWSDSFTTPVTDGRFEVELGETTPIPPALLATNFIDLDARVGATLTGLPRQRLVSVPYALRTGDVIPANRTMTIGPGGNFATIAEAFAWVQTKVARGVVTLQLMNGTHVLSPGGLRFEHSDGARIRLIGNSGDPTQVVVNASDQGLVVVGTLGELSGFRLVGSGATGTVGVKLTDHGYTSSHDLQIEGFDTALQLTQGSAAYVYGLTLTGLGPGTGSCFELSKGSHAAAGVLGTLSNCQIGIRVSDRSSLSVSGGTIANVSEGAYSTRGGLMAFEAVPFQIIDAGIAQHATLHGTLISDLNVTYTNVVIEKDPPVYTVGNGNSYIAQ